MKILFPLALAAALSASAQTQSTTPAAPAAPAVQSIPIQVVPPPGAAAQPTPLMQLPPATLVATVDGRKVTAGQLQAILRNVPAQYQQKIDGDRKEFITQYGMLVRLVELARKDKLEQQSPYKEAIEYQTMVALEQAVVERKKAELDAAPVAPEDIQKYYAANADRFNQVKFKAIYLPFNSTPSSAPDATMAQSGGAKAPASEAEAKAKADDLVKQARAGADFVKLVKENSGDPTSVAKDGDFPPIHKTENQVPAEIRKALFAAKAGEVTDPVRQPRGFYIFKIMETGPQPLDQVQDSIKTEVRNEQLKKWLDDLKKSVEVKLEGEPASTAAPVPSASVAPPQK
jgi:parvulin-like peptidyl-prolyl isomerase